MFVPLRGLKNDSPFVWWGFDKKQAGRPHLVYAQVKVLRVCLAVCEPAPALSALSTRRLQFISVGGTQIAPADEALILPGPGHGDEGGGDAHQDVRGLPAGRGNGVSPAPPPCLHWHTARLPLFRFYLYPQHAKRLCTVSQHSFGHAAY